MPELAVSAFLAGLLAGVHCVAMCGGIVGALNFHAREPAFAAPTSELTGVSDAAAALAIHAAYSVGRIGSYATAGAIAGGIGGTALLLDSVLPVQLALALAANALLVLLGLHLAGVGTPVQKLESGGGWLWRRIAPFGRRFVPANTPARALGVGAVWGWLPCGLVYSVLAMALVSGDAARGALVMLAFGLGTAPNVLAAGARSGTTARGGWPAARATCRRDGDRRPRFPWRDPSTGSDRASEARPCVLRLTIIAMVTSQITFALLARRRLARKCLSNTMHTARTRSRPFGVTTIQSGVSSTKPSSANAARSMSSSLK